MAFPLLPQAIAAVLYPPNQPPPLSAAIANGIRIYRVVGTATAAQTTRTAAPRTARAKPTPPTARQAVRTAMRTAARMPAGTVEASTNSNKDGSGDDTSDDASKDASKDRIEDSSSDSDNAGEGKSSNSSTHNEDRPAPRKTVPAATATATPISTRISQEAVHPSQACLGNALPTFVSAAAASNDVSTTSAGPLDTGKRTSPDPNPNIGSISLAISGKIADTHIACYEFSMTLAPLHLT